MWKPDICLENKITIFRYLALTLLLSFVFLVVGSTTSSVGTKHIEQHVVYLPITVNQSRWSEECIDCPHYFGNRSVDGAQLDSNGRIHVAYGGENLYYAVQDSSGHFAIQVVDEELRTGTRASLGIAPDGQPHIVYRDDGMQTWKYASENEIGWQIQDLELATSDHHPAAIAIDNAGNPHIAFGGNQLVYRLLDGSTWLDVVYDMEAGSVSMVLDTLDHPHIVYSDEMGRLIYRTFDGIDWISEVIGFSENYILGTSIVLDSSNNPHIAYVGSNSVIYAFKDGSEWQFETASSQLDCTSNLGISIELDQIGTPYIVYTDSCYSCVRFSCYPGLLSRFRENDGNWMDTPTWLNYSGSSGTLLIDAFDGIHVVYQSGNELRSLTGGSITTIDVAQRVSGNWGLEMVIDQDGVLHSTYERSSYAIYAYRESDSWQTETLTFWSELQPFRYRTSRLELGPANEVAITYPVYPYPYMYPDDCYYRLRERTESGWIEKPLGDIPCVYYLDLTIDSESIVHLSFADSDGLHYWFDPTSDFSSPESVDTDLVADQAIIINSADQPCIAYEVYGSGLKYTCSDGLEWETSFVLVDAVDLYSLSLDLDSGGQPHIVYVHRSGYNHGGINHAHYDGNRWHIEPVDWVSGEVSMTIDAQDRIHLSYRDWENDVIHAYRRDTGWQFEKIMIAGDATGRTAIAVDSQDKPRIAFIDGIMDDLKIIYKKPSE